MPYKTHFLSLLKISPLGSLEIHPLGPSRAGPIDLSFHFTTLVMGISSSKITLMIECAFNVINRDRWHKYSDFSTSCLCR